MSTHILVNQSTVACTFRRVERSFDHSLKTRRILDPANHENYSAENKFRTISGFLELISSFEVDFRRCGHFFERFEFLVCSGVSITCNVTEHEHVLWPVCTHTIPFRMLWRP